MINDSKKYRRDGCPCGVRVVGLLSRAAVAAELGVFRHHCAALGTMALQNELGNFLGGSGFLFHRLLRGFQHLDLLLQGFDGFVGGNNALAQGDDLGISDGAFLELGPQQVADLALELLNGVILALDL